MERKPGCTGKVPYFSVGEAITAKRQFTYAKKSLSMYHCHYLFNNQEHWHLTSMATKTYKQLKKIKLDRKKIMYNENMVTEFTSKGTL